MKKSIVPFLFTLFLLAGCGSPDKKEELARLKKEQSEIGSKIQKLEAELQMAGTPDPVARNATMVGISQVKEAPFVHYISVQGRIESDKNVLLSAKSAGTITRIFVTEGQPVKKGQVLVQIDQGMLNTAMEELKTGLDMANIFYDRQKSLWEQSIGTEMQYLQAKNNKESLEKKMASLQEQLQQTKILAPFAGVVDEVRIREGEVMAPGLPAIRLVSPSEFKVAAEIAENYITRVAKGNQVKVELPNLSVSIDSEVSAVSRVINPVNRTFMIEIELPDSLSSMIKANMITYVNVEDYRNSKAVVIPINAVQYADDGSKYVFVAESNKAVIRPVETGQTYNHDAEVLSGLKPGDKIIVTGQQNLTDKQAIAFQE